MARATAVIGANYGDEGKGLIIDYLASRMSGPKVVVRANGGAQAGHTVVTPTGERHVFSHFGAGLFNSAETYLAKHFVCNPVLFWTEAMQLRALGIDSLPVAVDPRCFVTTPYDMMLNQLVEDSRGDARHGSVGVGFGATIERNFHPAFQLWRGDLSDRKKVEDKVKLIRDQWIPTRTRQLKLPAFPPDDSRLQDGVMASFVDECVGFAAVTQVAGAEFLRGKSVLFEGAQGLALDMDHGQFPHVTRSNTGLKNIIPIAAAARLDLDAIYVTRAYATRHGAGPLPGEYAPFPPIEDKTNVSHPYQGGLRFGVLDTGAMRRRIAGDTAIMPRIKTSFALTCLDQVGDATASRLVRDLFPVLLSYGPCRNDVVSKEYVTRKAI